MPDFYIRPVHNATSPTFRFDGRLMKRLFIFGILLFAVTISGCIFDSDNDKKADTVKKGSVSGTVLLTVTKAPLANMKVYLIDKDAKIDMVNYEDNRNAFVDSAMTNSEGNYVIKNIAPGNYGVVPMNEDTTAVYKFSTSANSDSCRFSMNGDSLSVNFIAEKTDYPGLTESDMVAVTVTFLNPDQSDILGVTYERRTWALFIPVWENPVVLDDRIQKHDDGSSFISQSFYKGYTALLWSVDNTWRFTVTYQKKGEIRDKNASFIITYPLGPATFGEFTYDTLTGTLTETGRTIY